MAPGAFQFKPVPTRFRTSQNITNNRTRPREWARERETFSFGAQVVVESPNVKKSPVELGSEERVEESMHQSLYDIGCFAEVADCRYDLSSIWRFYSRLSHSGGPLGLYDGIKGSELYKIYQPTSQRKNRVLFVSRPNYDRRKSQLIIAFSGVPGTDLGELINLPLIKKEKGAAKVSSGLWGIYRPLRYGARAEAMKLINILQPGTVIVTGSATGAAQATFLALDLLMQNLRVKLRLVAFGSPRIGDYEFADWYKTKTDRYNLYKNEKINFSDFHVKGANDSK